MKSHIFEAMLALGGLGLLVASVYSQPLKSKSAENDECAQRLCQGEKLPVYDWNSYALFKVDHKFYIVPKQYGGLNGALGFFWPSRAPILRQDLAPELQRDKGRGVSNYSDVAIDIFIQSPNGLKVAPRSFTFIEEATAKGWVEKREAIRANLDEYTMKHIQGPGGYYLDRVRYYVATNLKGADGLPPVAACSHAREDSQGGSGFLRQGLWVGIRMNQKHCSEWSDIFPQIESVLAQVKEIQ